jgi:hypothetical protein
MNIAEYKAKLTAPVVNLGWVSKDNTLALIAEIERLVAGYRLISGRCTPEAQLTVDTALEPYEYSEKKEK